MYLYGAFLVLITTQNTFDDFTLSISVIIRKKSNILDSSEMLLYLKLSIWNFRTDQYRQKFKKYPNKGFNPENVKYVVDKALTLVSNGVDLDTFIEEVKQMNR